MTISEEIEESLGGNPPHRPIDDLLREGRTTVRRRRASRAVVAAAVVATLGGSTYAVGVGGSDGRPERDQRPQVATAPSADPVAVPIDPDGHTGPDVSPVYYRDGKLLCANADVEVLRVLDNAVADIGPNAAVEVRYAGTTRWELIMPAGKGTRFVSGVAPVSGSGQTFDEWVDRVAIDRLNIAPDLHPRLVWYDAQGAERLAPGVRVVERISNPFGVTAPAKSAALAVEKDGKLTWATIEWDDEPAVPGVTNLGVPNEPFATLQEWADYQLAEHRQPGAGS